MNIVGNIALLIAWHGFALSNPNGPVREQRCDPLRLRGEPVPYVIPDERTAEIVAGAVARAIYGAELIDSQRPFEISIVGNVVTVQGSLPGTEIAGRVVVGGTFMVKLCRFDGRVLLIDHDL